MVSKLKRHSVSGQLPVHLEQSLFDAQFSDTTEDEVDSLPQPHSTREYNSPSRYGLSKMERATSFDASTTSRVRKRLWRKKRRQSNTKEEAGPTTMDAEIMDSKQALLPPSSSTPSHSPQTSHTQYPWQQTTPPRDYDRDLMDHPASGESTPRPSHNHDLPITDEGDFSPAVAKFLESVKRPLHVQPHPHCVRRSSSNSSLRTHRRQGSNGSTHSYSHMISTSLSGSPVKGPSQCNSSSSLTRSRRAQPEHTSSRRGSGSGIQYSKIDSSSSEGEDKEHETGTQSSDHNTVNDGQSFFSRLKPAKSQTDDSRYLLPPRGHSSSSGRELYSNESSGEMRTSDGGHDADGESDVNSMDRLSELEPNESNLESLHSPSNVEESSDVTSTTPDIPDLDFTSPPVNPKHSDLQRSPVHNVAMLITQFETSPDTTLLGNLGSDPQSLQPDVPVHIRRDKAVPLAGSYSPKAVEDLLEGGR